MRGIHVLFIEDDLASQELVRDALESSGAVVQTARSGEDGLVAMQHMQFDLVITDYRLPRCTGLEVVRAIAGGERRVPVIMLSGSGDLYVVVQAMRLGASDYLVKDVENIYLDLLPGVVKRLMANQRLEQEKAEMQATLDRERRWSHLAIDRIQQGVSLFDADLRLQLCNRPFLAICKYPDELGQVGTSLEAIVRYSALRGDYGDECGEEHIQRRLARAAQPGSFRFERTFGDNTHVEICRDSLPEGGFVVTYTDVTERWRTEQRIRHQAYHDALTGLPNRLMFQELLLHQHAQAKRHGTSFALMFIDLDGFKAVNDCLGHHAGDALLVQSAQRLKRQLRETDVVARQGGDEFLVMLVGSNGTQASRIAQAMVDTLSQPFDLDEGIANISASIGIAAYPEAGASEDALLRAADDAMYRAKAAGKGCYCLA